ncbi:MAG TPA: sigma-70 family RNA polymerase sigma factor [Longimicrobiales bacterium]|nr:sigma-70 family RNA polymerase sigma factor [Longimicrobiales bacterium]
MASPTEWDLIARCRAGSAAAFEPLVRAHEARALAVATALLGDGDEAADAVQDAFVKAYRALDRLADGTDFGAWFRRILRNGCLDRLRSPSRRRRVRLDQGAVDAVRWEDADGLAAVEAHELARAVRTALAGLSAEHREILVLKEIEDMSYAAIAQSMGIPPGTVASRLHHARSALRRIVEAGGVHLERGEA